MQLYGYLTTKNQTNLHLFAFTTLHLKTNKPWQFQFVESLWISFDISGGFSGSLVTLQENECFETGMYYADPVKLPGSERCRWHKAFMGDYRGFSL